MLREGSLRVLRWRGRGRGGGNEKTGAMAGFSGAPSYPWVSGRRGLVPGAGLEPARLAAPDFKSGMSTNFIIRALRRQAWPAGCRQSVAASASLVARRALDRAYKQKCPETSGCQGIL